LLLVQASTGIRGSESRATHGHISLSHQQAQNPSILPNNQYTKHIPPISNISKLKLNFYLILFNN
jgi:hypothetical protein